MEIPKENSKNRRYFVSMRIVKMEHQQTFALNCICCCTESAAGEVVLGEDGKPIEGAAPPQVGEDGQPIVVDSAEAAAPVPEPEVKQTHLNVPKSPSILRTIHIRTESLSIFV